MLHLAIVLMLQQAAAPVPPADPKPPAAPVAVVQPAAPVVPATELLQVKNVYILPMGSSLDQYIANRLTRGGVLQVVTDPAKADAILTDRIGKALEVRLEQLYPDPAKLAAAEALAKQEAERDEDRPMQLKTNPIERGSSAGRAKGTLFLVHRGSRNVIWSLYEPPKSTRPNDLDDVAISAANNLGSAIGKEAKAVGAANAPAAKRKGWWPW
jgi:hypothetical protein